MKNKIIFFLVFILLFVIKGKSQNYSFEEVPQWVKKIDFPEESTITKYEITSGYYLKLFDHQINLDLNETFYHEVINVISYSGVTEASQISVVFDSSYQHVKIHYLYIWRKGKKIDYTNELSFEKMNNEYDLQEGIYSGRTTLYDILNDIRKDDQIDFAYSVTGINPILENEKFLFIPLDVLNPVDLYVVRVLFSKDKNYDYRCVDCDSINFTSEEIDSYQQIEITNNNLTSLKIEDYVPSWTIPYKYFILSSFKSWKGVNLWAQNVFALSSLPNLNIVFEEIFIGNESIEEKINKIINYVQDDIRYMGIESGIGSIKPFHPEQVVKQRYGDCKDKSLLLVSLLKNIGIEKAYPALVNTTMKHELGNYFPSNEVFDHCIVMFEYNDTTYWVDPTITLQGGDFKNLYYTDYGKALVIGIAEDTLYTINPSSSEGYTELYEELTAKSFTQPAQLTITSNRYGFEADYKRASLEYYAVKDFEESVKNDLKVLYPTINSSEDIEIIDDIDKNNFTLTYHYSVDDFWQDGDKSDNPSAKGYWMFYYNPLDIAYYFKESLCEERKFDYELYYPLNLKYHAILNFPKELLISDEYRVFDNEAFYYDESIEQISSSSLKVDYNFYLKTNHIKKEDFIKICEQINSIASSLDFIIYFVK